MQRRTTRREAVMFTSLGFLLGLGGLVAAGAGDRDSRPEAPDDEPAASRTVTARRTASREDAVEGPCSFMVGTRMAYEVITQTHTTIDMSPLLDRAEVDDPRMTTSWGARATRWGTRSRPPTRCRRSRRPPRR